VDGHRLALVIEDDDFEEPARTVSTDVETAVSSVDDAYGVADGACSMSKSSTPCLRAASAISTCAGYPAHPM